MLVVTSITIEGKPIKQFRMLTIEQGIFAHHTFQLTCPAEAIDKKEGPLFNTSAHWIGAPMHVEIQARAGQALQFTGLITQVSTAKQNGHAGDVIISGSSPTIILDNGPHCASWEERSLQHIVQNVLKPFPQNRLQPDITISPNGPLPYTVQYQETAWQFLRRLVAAQGEWLLYDGQKLVVGKPLGESRELVYGRHLSRFNLSMHARPASFQAMAYDYQQPELFQSESPLLNGPHHVIKNSSLLYKPVLTQWHNSIITSKKQLDDVVALQAALQQARMVCCNGCSDVPALQPGTYISVKGSNVYSNQDEVYGNFLVFSVTHTCDGQGHYRNEFMAVPASVTVPPVPFIPGPRCDTQSAIVTDNHDTQGMGRIRVRFHWMKDHEKSPWLRVAGLYAGSGKGFFTLPEIGEEVIVAFEGDHPARPFVVGCVYNGKATCDFANAGNDLKIFQTRSGNKIQLDDAAGSVMVSDKAGNSLKLDGSGIVQLIANDMLVLRCGDAIIKLNKDGAITMNGKELSVSTSSDVRLKGQTIRLN